MTTYQRKQRAAQERRELTTLAIKRRKENASWTAIGEELGVPKSSVEAMVQRTGALTCGCGETMRRPSNDGLCGFCQAEQAVEVAA